MDITGQKHQINWNTTPVIHLSASRAPFHRLFPRFTDFAIIFSMFSFDVRIFHSIFPLISRLAQ